MPTIGVRAAIAATDQQTKLLIVLEAPFAGHTWTLDDIVDPDYPLDELLTWNAAGGTPNAIDDQAANGQWIIVNFSDNIVPVNTLHAPVIGPAATAALPPGTEWRRGNTTLITTAIARFT